MLSGVPAHVDGRMLGVARTAGASRLNTDRMWHYTEGVANHDPIWPGHGIRILPGPSSLWLDARGRRLPAPLFPGFDTLGALAHIASSGDEHTWFVATRKIVEKEFALSGSEQNPDLTGRSVRQVLGRARSGAAAPVRAFLERGEDFVVRDTLPELVAGMNALTPHAPLDPDEIERLVVARDREVLNPFTKDLQIAALRGARRYRGDRLIRVARPHRLLDPSAGPLVAVRLRVLTRKTLGGLETDLDGARAAPRRRGAARAVRRGRGRGLRRRRHARLRVARGDVPRRLPLLRAHRGPRRRRRDGLTLPHPGDQGRLPTIKENVRIKEFVGIKEILGSGEEPEHNPPLIPNSSLIPKLSLIVENGGGGRGREPSAVRVVG